MAIKKCNCKHVAQDQIHGENMRVANECKSAKEATRKKFRCTVCGKELE